LTSHAHRSTSGTTTSSTDIAVDMSVVIPVYGGERTIGTLTEGLLAMFDQQGIAGEVILVCDRPRDGSWAVVRQLHERHDRVTAVHLQRNFGQHPATLAGLRMCRGTWVATMDEDLQHSPLDIPVLWEQARTIDGIAYGRFTEPQHGLWRNLTSRLAKWVLATYIGGNVAANASAFRVFPARLRDSFAHYSGERVAIDVLLSWSGAPVTTVPCQHAPRADGHSGYTLRKLLAYLADLLVGYSTLPLRFASFLGLASVALALLIGAYVLLNWLRYGSAVPGFAFLAISTSVLSGAQLLALGIIGEYLGRLYFNNLGKPQYVIHERLNARSHQTPPRVGDGD
jgi:glycosyltransferase involved in cell wall biosynthesis